jgi:hypothetical protein
VFAEDLDEVGDQLFIFPDQIEDSVEHGEEGSVRKLDGRLLQNLPEGAKEVVKKLPFEVESDRAEVPEVLERDEFGEKGADCFEKIDENWKIDDGLRGFFGFFVRHLTKQIA